MTPRRRVWLVARRELLERSRSRAFRISTVLTVLLVLAAVVLPSVLGGGGPTAYDVGVVGPAPAGLADGLRSAAQARGDRVRIATVADRRAAVRGLREGDLDAALAPPRQVLVDGDPEGPAAQLARGALAAAAQRARLRAAGLSPAQVQQALGAPAVAVQDVGGGQGSGEARAVANLGVVFLYVALLTFGIRITYGVIEEKSSRVVELLLATVRPRELLAGKVVGIGLLGLGQLGLTAVVALAAGLLLRSVELPEAAPEMIGLVVLWFALGYALYATAFAAAGSLVSRQEDAQSVSTPLFGLVIGAYFVALAAINDPSGGLAVVASYLPPLAPMVVPARVALGEMGVGGLLVSVALTLLATALLVRVAGRVYARAILRTGAPVKVREALRLPAR